MINNKDNFFFTFFDFFIDKCTDQNFKFIAWVKNFFFFFIILLLILLIPSIILFFFQYLDGTYKKFIFTVIIIKGFLLSLLISLTITILCILLVIIIKFIYYIFIFYSKILNINFLIKNTEKGIFLLENLKEYYPSFIFILFLFSLIIWLRLIRERLPMDLNQTFEFGLQTIIVGIITVSFFVLFLFNYYNLIIIKSNKESKIFIYLRKKEEKIFSHYVLYNFIKKHILYGPLNVFNIIFFHIDLQKFFFLVQKFCMLNFIDQEKKPFFFFWSIKFSIILIFFIEVVFYKQIIYFYKLIFLLIFPVIYEILLYIAKEHVQRNLDYLSEYLEITVLEDKTLSFKSINIDETLFKIEFDIEEVTKDWFYYKNILKFYNNYKFYKEKYNIYFFLIYLLLYFVTFFFYLIILFNVY